MSRFHVNESEKTGTEEKTPTHQFICVRLGSEEYVVDIYVIREIIMLHDITYVPRVANHFEGLINLHGNVVPVINLRLKLGMEDADFTSSSRIIITDAGGALVGLIVDEVTKALNLPVEKIELTTEAVGEVPTEYIHGIGKTDNGIVGWLNLEKLVAR